METRREPKIAALVAITVPSNYGTRYNVEFTLLDHDFTSVQKRQNQKIQKQKE